MTNCVDDENILLHTNGGDIIFREKGVFKMIPVDMYYDNKAISTVL